MGAARGRRARAHRGSQFKRPLPLHAADGTPTTGNLPEIPRPMLAFEIERNDQRRQTPTRVQAMSVSTIYQSDRQTRRNVAGQWRDQAARRVRRRGRRRPLAQISGDDGFRDTATSAGLPTDWAASKAASRRFQQTRSTHAAGSRRRDATERDGGQEGRLKQRHVAARRGGGWASNGELDKHPEGDLVRSTAEIARTIGAVAKGRPRPIDGPRGRRPAADRANSCARPSSSTSMIEKLSVSPPRDASGGGRWHRGQSSADKRQVARDV